MAEYMMGSPADPTGNGKRVKLTDEDLAKHMLIIGGTQKGKSSMLKHLVNLHLRLDRSFSLFDSKGDLYDHAFAALITRNDRDVMIVDTQETRAFLQFDPLGERHIRTHEQLGRLTKTVLEAGWREGINLELSEDNPPQGLEDVVALLTHPGTYAHHSMSVPKNAIDLYALLRGGEKFLVKAPRERGSYLYGMLLFNDFLLAAEIIQQESLYLVFVDEAFAFIGTDLPQVLGPLTEHRIALVVTTTYKQLGWFKLRYRRFYESFLDGMGCISAYGADDDDPDDVVSDVAGRLSPRP